MRANIKTNIKRGIAVGLMAIMAAINPMQTLQPTGAESTTVAKAAETGKAPYIGEVRLAVDKDANTAKQILESEGYEVIDQDLNEKAGSWWNKQGDQAVYMGIKRTDDESKAIKDMKTMNMCGKYSYSDLSNWVKENRETAKEKCEPLRIVIKEFKENINNGDRIAKDSLEALNHIKETDSGKGVGDYILDCDEEGMVKVLVEGNGDLVASILELLYKGCESKKDTWLERLSVTTKKSITKEYAKELYGKEKVIGSEKAEVEKRMQADYDKTAKKILEKWDTIRDLLVKNDVETEFTKEEQELIDEDKILEFYFEAMDTSSKVEKSVLTEALSKIPYNGKSLLQFFSLDKKVFEKDITRLYPMAAALTEGQSRMVEYTSLSDFVQTALTRIETRKNKSTDNEKIDPEKTLMDCPLYAGVDRAMFKEGAAMTSRATRDFSQADRGTTGLQYAFYTCLGITIFATGITLWQYKKAWAADDLTSIYCDRYNNVTEELFGDKYLKEVFKMDEAKLNEILDDSSFVDEYEITDASLLKEKETQYEQKFLLSKEKANTSFTRARIMLAISVIMAIVTTTLYIINMRESRNRQQLAIPTVIVDKDVESTVTGYVAYSCVLWNKDRNDDSGRDNRGDLNGDAGDQWLALYTTTDKAMGTPILADSIVAKTGKAGGENVPSGDGYEPLSMFGNESVQNLVDEQYSYNDSVNGIYVWYQKEVSKDTIEDDIEDTEGEAVAEADDASLTEEVVSGTAAEEDIADTTGSNIGGGNTVLIALGGGVVGIIVGIFIGFFIRRKKQVVD